jgi:hypothetical protein
MVGDRADGVWASDHFGVVADLAVPAHPPGAAGLARSRAAAVESTTAAA